MASEPSTICVCEPSARRIARPFHDQVMLEVVLTYVNAPDHVGATEPRISTPDFAGSTLFFVSAPAETRAKSSPSVTLESSESFRLFTPETTRFSDSYRCVLMRFSASIWGMFSIVKSSSKLRERRRTRETYPFVAPQ